MPNTPGTESLFDGRKLRLLDLCSGAGGAAVGYATAGFEVVGVDVHPQPRYPFEFHQVGALAVLETFLVTGEWTVGGTFDALHASWPCEGFSRTQVIQGRSYVDFLIPGRALMEQTGLPWVIENVPGAPMPGAIEVCAAASLTADGFELRRHRLFQASFSMMAEPCSCGSLPPAFAYGHSQDKKHKDRYGPCGAETRRQVMGVPWMNRDELAKAIPPAFTELIGYQLMQHVRQAVAA